MRMVVVMSLDRIRDLVHEANVKDLKENATVRNDDHSVDLTCEWSECDGPVEVLSFISLLEQPVNF
jgi:hypothetical protein